MLAYGAWAGRLGNGLQNRVERFDSARHLTKELEEIPVLFLFSHFGKTNRGTGEWIDRETVFMCPKEYRKARPKTFEILEAYLSPC